MLTVYKASAGSGKTYTLTYEYIKLLLGVKNEDGTYRLNKTERDKHRAILGITFTNKATSEMKQRIVNELALLAKIGNARAEKKESPYTKDLIKVFGCTAEELRECAESALHDLLFDFLFFNINTIDAFFQNVLRVFAREAELSGDYDVEIDDEYAITSGVSEVLSSLNRYDNKAEDDADAQRRRRLVFWLRKYMMNQLKDSDKGFNMFNRSSGLYSAVVSFVKKMCRDDFKSDSERILQYLRDEEKIVAFEQEVSEKYNSQYRLIVEKSRKVLDLLGRYGLTPEDCLNKDVRRSLVSWANSQEGNVGKTMRDFVENPEGTRSKWFLAKFKGEIPATLPELYIEALTEICYGAPRLAFYKMTRENVYMLGLLSGVLNEIERYRNENNLILLSDTNEILQRIISEDELPFIYERVGTRLKHFLIDEFQDTSRMQWENLRPLVSESLSHDYDNLIIGDEKQCIYRFRDSDPSLLREQVRNQFERNVIERGDNISENTNWRSSAEVVRFNNTFFTAVAQIAGVENLYSNVAQQVAPKHNGHHGYVRLNAIDAKLAEDFANESLLILAQEIGRQLQSGYKMSDIAILVRDGSDGRKAIDYLLDYVERNPEYHRLNILSDGALVVGGSNAVRFIISVLKIIDTPEDESDKRKLMLREISRLASRYEYLLSLDENPSQALDKALRNRDGADDMLGRIVAMECLNLPSIIERITSYLPKTVLADENVYITAFQDMVIDYCSRGTGDIRSFLRWWDTCGCRTCLSFPDSLDAIKVITIHKSKGLEFKCVHIPFADWKMAKDEDVKWFDTVGAYNEFPSEIVPPSIPLKSSKILAETAFKEQYEKNHEAEVIDQLNVTYVAFTRAVDELIVNYYNTENPNSVGGLITQAIAIADKAYCEASMARLGGLPAENLNVFIPLRESVVDGNLIIGEPTQCVPIQEDEQEAVITMPAYSTVERDDIWNLSRVEELQDIDKPRDRGVILHDVLSRVKHGRDVPLAVRRHAYKLLLPEPEILEITEFLSNAVKAPEVTRWFENYRMIVRERTIITQSGERYRPDRVVWAEDGTVEVVDYKFGEPHPRRYAEQVRGYMALLQNIGYDKVKGFIWYLDSGKIVEVSK